MKGLKQRASEASAFAAFAKILTSLAPCQQSSETFEAYSIAYLCSKVSGNGGGSSAAIASLAYRLSLSYVL